MSARQYLVVVNIFERVADHADAHVDQVRGRHLENLLGELLPVLVDLLSGEDVQCDVGVGQAAGNHYI